MDKYKELFRIHIKLEEELEKRGLKMYAARPKNDRRYYFSIDTYYISRFAVSSGTKYIRLYINTNRTLDGYKDKYQKICTVNKFSENWESKLVEDLIVVMKFKFALTQVFDKIQSELFKANLKITSVRWEDKRYCFFDIEKNDRSLRFYIYEGDKYIRIYQILRTYIYSISKSKVYDINKLSTDTSEDELVKKFMEYLINYSNDLNQ